MSAYFHSKNALVPLTSNHPGIQNDVVDELVMSVLNARSIPDLTAAQRALDRVLLWNFYFIPVNAIEGPRVLYWDKFSRPDMSLRTGVMTGRWWYDESKATALENARQ